MVEKLLRKLPFIASIAVIIPINAMIPNAIMATVMPVRNLFPRTVLNASERESESVMKAVSYQVSAISFEIIHILTAHS